MYEMCGVYRGAGEGRGEDAMALFAAVYRASPPQPWVRRHMQPYLLALGVGRDGQPAADSRRQGAVPGADSLDRREFESFFRTHEPAISGFLYRMVGDTQAAADLSQETFFRAWQRFAQIRGYERPQAWLFRVATNLALQHLRRRSSPVGSAHTLDEQFEPSESDPGRRFALRDLVRETLLELPARPRALLVLREAYGFSAEEAASALGMSLTAAKVALWRARTQFRAIYLRKDGQE
jgi:RNA polymerase sigma-70 factor, ECF subfamily